MNTSHVFGPSSSTDALERWSSAKALFLPAGVVGAPPRSEGRRTAVPGAVTSSFAGSRSAISPSEGTCVKQPKTARKQFDSLEQKTRNGLDSLGDKLEERTEYLLDKDPVENMGDAKALIQKLEELKIIHTKLLRDTIRAKFWRSNFILEDTSVLHFWNLFHALEVKEQRRFSWLSDQFLLKEYFPFLLDYDEDLSKLILDEDNSFLAILESHVEILSTNKATSLSEKSPYLHRINETIGFLLEKSLTVTHAHTLKVISTVLDFIIKNHQDYDVMGFSQRGSPTKEAFDLRYASLDLIEELVRIDNYLHGFYHHQYDYNGSSDLILTLNGKTKSELYSQVGLIDSYIKITYNKHVDLIKRLWDTNPIFRGHDLLDQIDHRRWGAQSSIRYLQNGLREETSRYIRDL
ncbi:hypothetical protein H4Q26_010098 [Puccinia striiformis f. sp. tritici PST-130]|nr:hypothetical protein H4Q26_010098 [Puccinia striiformis f. sp. tritici PST-130]